MAIGIGIGLPFRRVVSGPDGIPSLLNIDSYTDTQIVLSWTIGSTKKNKNRIYI